MAHPCTNSRNCISTLDAGRLIEPFLDAVILEAKRVDRLPNGELASRALYRQMYGPVIEAMTTVINTTFLCSYCSMGGCHHCAM